MLEVRIHRLLDAETPGRRVLDPATQVGYDSGRLLGVTVRCTMTKSTCACSTVESTLERLLRILEGRYERLLLAVTTGSQWEMRASAGPCNLGGPTWEV